MTSGPRGGYAKGRERRDAILAAESVDPDHPAHAWFVARYHDRRAELAGRLAQEQREGTVASDFDPDAAAAQILAMFDGLQIQWLLDPGRTDMVALFGDFLGRFAPRG